ncbi:MAG: hypothetical protein ACUVRP_00025 [Chlorobiales bacterium]
MTILQTAVVETQKALLPSESPGSSIIPNTTFNLNVTRYEAVGGRIQGSYSGTLREVGDKGVGSATLTITGNFNVQRLEDGFEDERTIDLLRYKTDVGSLNSESIGFKLVLSLRITLNKTNQINISLKQP